MCTQSCLYLVQLSPIRVLQEEQEQEQDEEEEGQAAVGHHRPPTSPRSPLVNTRSRYPRVPIVLPPTPRAAHAHRKHPSETPNRLDLSEGLTVHCHSP